MILFSKLVKPGQTIVEVGGHIGYITLFFSFLAGGRGRVFVFEPGSNNIPYIRENITPLSDGGRASINLIEAAVGERNGIVSFFEDSLTGQNNSVIESFDGLLANQKNAYVKSSVVRREVKLVTLDSYFSEESVDFIKIDIEGYEWPCLQGARNVIESKRPAMMVEVQANRAEIFAFFEGAGYVLFDRSQRILGRAEDLRGNIFALHRDAHSGAILSLELKNAEV